MRSGQTIFRPEGRYTSGPKSGRIMWVRYQMGSRPLKYRIRFKLRKAVGEVSKIIARVRVSKHHNKPMQRRKQFQRRKA